MVSQDYRTEAENEFVIRGNSGVLKCKIPSFVADFVSIVSWVSDDGSEITRPTHSYGKQAVRSSRIEPIPMKPRLWQDVIPENVTLLSNLKQCLLPVVSQQYETEAENEYVIRGNSIAMKCKIPSFVSDFISVISWVDSNGNTFTHNNDYGNSTIVFCLKYFIHWILFPPKDYYWRL